MVKKKQNNTIRGRNILGLTIKIGNRTIPLNIRIVSKQGRGNTDKPSLFDTMIREVLNFFDAEGIELRKYPITFDSWYGSKKLIQSLSDLGFDRILVHGKNNYVMTIGGTKTKLSEHKKQIQLNTDQWGCHKPHCRILATSPTLGSLVVLFFLDRGKMRTMLVFGKPLRACEILRIWSQHHSIEQFWRHLKSDLKLSKMSLETREGAYTTLGVKVISYLMLQDVSRLVGKHFIKYNLNYQDKDIYCLISECILMNQYKVNTDKH